MWNASVSRLSSTARARRLIPFAIAALLGATIGLALAQDRRAGQLDVACASNCTAHGYEPEFCGRVCWLPDPAIAAKAEPLDWICMTDCLERGGKVEDCRLRCKRR
jgi:hypothetical protein